MEKKNIYKGIKQVFCITSSSTIWVLRSNHWPIHDLKLQSLLSEYIFFLPHYTQISLDVSNYEERT